VTEDEKEIRRPKPTAEPQEPPPGGPHAVPGVGGDGPYSRVSRDMDPRLNPETNEVPDETTEGEDTETEATKGGDEQPSESEPAG